MAWVSLESVSYTPSVGSGGTEKLAARIKKRCAKNFDKPLVLSERGTWKDNLCVTNTLFTARCNKLLFTFRSRL